MKCFILIFLFLILNMMIYGEGVPVKWLLNVNVIISITIIVSISYIGAYKKFTSILGNQSHYPDIYSFD